MSLMCKVRDIFGCNPGSSLTEIVKPITKFDIKILQRSARSTENINAMAANTDLSIS